MVKKFFNLKKYLLIAACAMIVSCSKDGTSNTGLSNSSGNGTGGSLSKFTIVGNYMYAVDQSSLYTYNITDPLNPVKTNSTNVTFNVETIYPFNNRLFIGTTTGLFIYSIANPSAPVKMGEASHARSCDPVVANDSIAFVTLKGNASCGPATSGLYVHDIKNILQPLLLKTVAINDPEGLGLKGNILYLCCNNNGLKVFNVTRPENPVDIKTVQGYYFKDVIPYDNLLICFVSTGIVLYDISNPLNPTELTFVAN